MKNSHSKHDIYLLEAAKSLPESHKSVVSELLASSRRMLLYSRLSIVGIGIVTVVAILVILFAGFITSIDLTGTASLRQQEYDNIRQEYVTSLRRVEELNRENLAAQRDLVSLFPILQDFNNLDDVIWNRDPIQFIIPTTDTEREAYDRFNSVATELAFLNKRVPELKAELDRATSIVDGILGLNSNTEKQGATATQTLIASAVTRFGLILVLLFFAQALLGVYRYSLLMSSTHRSRANALVLGQGSIESTAMFSSILSTDHIGMGKPPSVSVEEIKSATEAVSSLAKP